MTPDSSTNTGVELLPCPFCGNSASAMRGRGWSVACDGGVHDCHVSAETGEFPTEAQAITAWNTRKGTGGDELARELADRLRRARGQGWHPFALDVVEIAEDAITALRSDHGAGNDWFAGTEDSDGNELVTIRADELARLREALLKTQAMLETIDRTNSTNFNDVRGRIFDNRAALGGEQ